MLAAVYLRISQDRSGEELGIGRQREACMELLERRGWTLYEDVYVENNTSARGHKARPEWGRMMADLEAGKFKVVVGWSLDRVLRSGRDRLRVLESGKKHGVLLAMVRGSDMDLSKPADRMSADILGAVALNEIETKSDRQRAMHLQAAKNGRRVGGRRPFGYEQDGTTVRRSEADAVRNAFLDYRRGVPLSVIATRWNEAGLLSGQLSLTTGEPTQWDHSGVRAILQNPRYCGLRALNGEVMGPAQWPGLVDEPTFRSVNALLNSAAAEFKPRGGRRMLTGLARCGVCDTPIHCGGNKAGGAPVYRCPSGRHVTRRAEPVEDAVSGLMVAWLQRKDVLDALAQQDDPDSSAQLAVRADELRREMDTIALERTQRTITPRQFAAMNADLMAQLDVVERQMSQHGPAAAVVALTKEPMTMARWTSMESEQCRFLISSLCRIRLHSGGRGVRNPPPETIEVEPLFGQPSL